MPGTCAVVVTHNRLPLLRKCLTALAEQTHAPDTILVVDNASTDGTAQMLAADHPHASVLRLETNEGGAGGFHAGLARAHESGAEWIWLMDDDTIPTPTALAELLAASQRIEPRPQLLASQVVWTDGRQHPMNFPTIERRRMERVVRGAREQMLPVRSATFVSLLVHRSAVDRFGLPLKHFFLWADDIEYTSRIVLGGGGAYWVPASLVRHETAAPADFRTAAPDRFYFHVRNTLFTARAPGRPARDRLLRLYIVATTCLDYLARTRSVASARAIARGVRDGLFSSAGGARRAG